MRFRLLVSDVDDTLLGNEDALARFADWLRKTRSEIPDFRLAYASGRFYDSLVGSIENANLPEPDMIIGGVGTDIRLYPAKQPVDGWHEVGKDRWDPERVHAVVAHDPRIARQPEAQQSPRKVSYYFSDASPADLTVLRMHLYEAGIEADLIYSSSRDLDVVPANVNKGTAAVFVAENLGVPREHVLVAGNSANDADLFHHGFRGIVVGNAHEELKLLGGPSVYVAQAHHADGVLEGIAHWSTAPAEA